MAIQQSCVKWQSGESSGLVSIGTHRLFLRAGGPIRSAGSPAVILEAGLGDSSTGWAAVLRLISAFTRVYAYDRAGYGRSDPTPPGTPRSASNIALELSQLLDAANIRPPYVLVGHSYGGILVREFLALRPHDIAGMVLVDANQERTYVDCAFPWPQFFALTANQDYLAVRGIDKSHALSQDEWAALVKEGEQQDRVAPEREIEFWQSSADVLGEKGQLTRQPLGDSPLSVIKGNSEQELRRVSEAGIAAGNGDESERAIVREVLNGFDDIEERLQREQIKLSINARYVYAKASGHNVQLTEPALIAEEVKWVLDLCKEPS